MISIGNIFACAFLLYVGAGIVTAILFVTYGVSKVMHGAPVTPGARICFIPASIALWPLVLRRWWHVGNSQ